MEEKRQFKQSMTDDLKQFLEEHSSLYLDAMIFVYLFEDYPQFGEEVSSIFESIEENENQGFTSKLTLSEILVQPYRLKAKPTVNRYLNFLYNFPHLELISINDSILLKTASLRAKSNLRTPDAIHVTSALEKGASGFITADQQIKPPSEVDLDMFYLTEEE